jgi:mono/diheme cytochrome c family protein
MRFACCVRSGIFLIGASACLGISKPGRAQVPADYFRQNCTSCHTIGGGRLTGPDLKDVPQRKDRAWLVKYLQNPKAMIDSGDPYAAQLLQESRGVVMPTVAGMTPDVANSLLDLIEAESKLAKSQFAGISISDRPFTAADIVIGRRIFFGERPLMNGGPACISCHTLGTIGSLGGGRLGPDLTRVDERLGGRKGVGTWLSAPATPTMQSVFRKHALQSDEILRLLATFEDASKRSQPADTSSILNFFLFGFSGMLAGLAVLQLAWRGRLRFVRRLIVRGELRGEQ